MDISEINATYVVGATVGVEEGFSASFGNKYKLFRRDNVSVKVSAEVRFQWMDADVGC